MIRLLLRSAEYIDFENCTTDTLRNKAHSAVELNELLTSHIAGMEKVLVDEEHSVQRNDCARCVDIMALLNGSTIKSLPGISIH
jgi:hypothetical protein